MPHPELMPYQEKALNRLKNGSILWAPVGTGKSRVGLAYYVKHESPKPVYVVTTAKVRDDRQWEGEAASFAIGTEAGVMEHGLLVVDSWNNLHKYVDVEGAFFIFDEQRLVGNGQWVKSFLKIVKRNNWILLTATPGDTWMDYVPVFLAHGFYKNRTAFKNQHVVYKPWSKFPSVARYVGVGRLTRLRNSILVEMPFEKARERKTITVPVNHDFEMLERVTKERWNDLTAEPIRDVTEMFYCMRRVVNSDPSRVKAIRKLTERHPRLIVYYSFNYELEALRELQNDFTVAEWNGHKHEPIPDTDEWIYLVQYVAGSEGWNCTSTNAIVFYSLTYSYKNWEQAHGRIDRMNSNFVTLFYYVLRSTAKIDSLIYHSLMAKKSFQEGQYHDKF